MLIKPYKCDFIIQRLFSCSDSLINFYPLVDTSEKKTLGSVAQRDLCLSFHDLCVCQSVSWADRVFLTDRDRRVSCSYTADLWPPGPSCHATVMAFLWLAPCISSHDIVYILYIQYLLLCIRLCFKKWQLVATPLKRKTANSNNNTFNIKYYIFNIKYCSLIVLG